MEKKYSVNYICEELNHNRDVEIDYNINGIPYKIKVLGPDELQGINITRIIAIPLSKRINNQIIVESNNLESDNLKDVLEQGAQTALRLATLTADLPAPIVIPLLPSYKNGPYFQQLSRECFGLPSQDRNYRIDEQVVSAIEDSQRIIEEETAIQMDKRIFLNGYSSSGVFAQRFALLHPDIIETLCVGGASGSIPLPTQKIGYPIGIADYKELTGKNFDSESYKKIIFKYYVGELETKNKVNTRYDDNGNPAPMHDMSYFVRSIPKQVGEAQREILGKDLFERAQKTIDIMINSGFDIEHTIIPGRTHNNKNGRGVNELGDKIINDAYKASIKGKINESVSENENKNYI